MTVFSTQSLLTWFMMLLWFVIIHEHFSTQAFCASPFSIHEVEKGIHRVHPPSAAGHHKMGHGHVRRQNSPVCDSTDGKEDAYNDEESSSQDTPNDSMLSANNNDHDTSLTSNSPSGSHLRASRHGRSSKPLNFTTVQNDTHNINRNHSIAGDVIAQNTIGNLTYLDTRANPASLVVGSIPSSSLSQNNLYLGWLPDDGSSGGTRTTMAHLNAITGSKSAAYGWYAQAHSGIKFDGSQLLSVIDDVKACNCVFQPAVMPVGGWSGLTASDNSQAVAIANVMKKFTDQGIPVWLRFAHEVNYYQKDGTYQGTAADFKAGWAAVSAAVKSIAPLVKMWWTPNVDTASGYSAYEPSDMSSVDLVGIDFYPKSLTGNDFLQQMQAFHDKYAVDGRVFAIGETGLGWAGSSSDKFKWLDEVCKAKTSMPQFVSMSWFNFDKEYDYKIVGENNLNKMFATFISA